MTDPLYLQRQCIKLAMAIWTSVVLVHVVYAVNINCVGGASVTSSGKTRLMGEQPGIS